MNKIQIDFVHAEYMKNATYEQIPLNKWVIIDGSSIRINYAIKENKKIHVYTARVYSNSESYYTEKDYTEWRDRINQTKD